MRPIGLQRMDRKHISVWWSMKNAYYFMWNKVTPDIANEHNVNFQSRLLLEPELSTDPTSLDPDSSIWYEWSDILYNSSIESSPIWWNLLTSISLQTCTKELGLSNFFREWKQLWDTFTCVGRLICREGHVPSLNKSNPTNQSLLHPRVLVFPVPSGPKAT